AVDPRVPEAVRQVYILHSRRLAMAGKILFPIPNRGVAKRLYRVTADTLVLWGTGDRFIPPVYAERWAPPIPRAQAGVIERAGRMPPYEQPDAVVRAVIEFLA